MNTPGHRSSSLSASMLVAPKPWQGGVLDLAEVVEVDVENECGPFLITAGSELRSDPEPTRATARSCLLFAAGAGVERRRSRGPSKGVQCAATQSGSRSPVESQA